MMSSTAIPRTTATTPVDIASLNIKVPVPSPAPAHVAPVNAGRDRDPQLVRRVRELEEEVRNLRNENEKQVRPSLLFYSPTFWRVALWAPQSGRKLMRALFVRRAPHYRKQ